MSDSLEAQLSRLSLGNRRNRVRTRDKNPNKELSSGAGVATSGKSPRSKAKGGDDNNTTTTTQVLRPVDNNTTNGGRVKKPSKKKKKKNHQRKGLKRAARNLSTEVTADDLHAALERALKEGAGPNFMPLAVATAQYYKPFGSYPEVAVKDFAAADLDPASAPRPSMSAAA